jgi:dienelactone hydrolase
VTRRGAAVVTPVLGLLLGAPAPAAQPGPPTPETLRVLDPVEPGPRITPYLQHQLEVAWRQDDRRRAAFEAVRSETDLQALRASLRAKVLEIIGGLPATRTPLNARVTGTIPMDGYRIEKVLFESLPGLHVTALLYVPEGPAGVKRPGVLVACGHSPDGKSFRNYQEISGQLARRGYVVLSWDPVGQGERSQFWDAARGQSRYNLVCGEHAVMGNLACLAGTSLVRYMVWDGMRALDYLLTRPEVDPARLAVTGTSGGGFQSLYLGALDERIGVVAPSCFVTSLPMRMANRIFEDPDSDPEQDPYRLVAAGVDHAGLLLLVYPRPFVVAAAVNDFFPIEGARKTFREVAALYAARGKGDRVSIAEGVHRHQFSPENRRAAFAVFDRVNGLPERSSLDPIRILEPAALRVTPSGQVRVDLPGRSLPEVIREDFRARAPRPALRLADLYFGDGYPGIRDWPVTARADAPAEGTIAWVASGGATVDGLRLDRYRLHHSRRLVVPVLHVFRPGATPARTVLDLALEGKATVADWPELRRRVEAGDAVLSFDLRGAGETRMRFRTGAAGDPEVARLDDLEAYASPISGVLANHVYNALLTGRPHFLELLEDVEIVARFARERLGATRLAVRARGEAGALADTAAQVLPGLERQPSGEPFRWSEVVETMRETWPIQYLLPGGAWLDGGPPEGRGATGGGGAPGPPPRR